MNREEAKWGGWGRGRTDNNARGLNGHTTERNQNCIKQQNESSCDSLRMVLWRRTKLLSPAALWLRLQGDKSKMSPELATGVMREVHRDRRNRSRPGYYHKLQKINVRG